MERLEQAIRKDENAHKHYAGRWICQKDAGRCNGRRSVYGEPRSCPLAYRCLNDRQHPFGQLLWLWPENRFRKLCIQSEPDWDRKHLNRRQRAMAAFCRDEVKAYYKGYREKNKEELNRKHREIYAPSIERLFPGQARQKNARKIPPPPCGGDCRNCPHETCKFQTWEEDYMEAHKTVREKYPAVEKRYQEKLKQRRREDTELDAVMRARSGANAANYRKRVKAMRKEAERRNQGVEKRRMLG